MIYVQVHCLTFAILKIDPDRIVMLYVPTLPFTATYFIASLICNLCQDGFEDIGNSLYNSKCYLMSMEDKKDLLKILMVTIIRDY